MDKRQTILIGSIPGPAIKEQIERCMRQGAIPEWRVDLWNTEEVPEGKKFLFTLQRKGKPIHEWLDIMRQWSQKVKPSLVDIDLEAAEICFKEAKKLFPKAKWIISSHGSKEPFDALVRRGHALKPAIVKIVQEIQSPLDAFQLLDKVKKWNEKGLLTVGIGTGRGGELTRILAPLAGMPYMFASLSSEEAVFPGQLSIQELQETYGFSRLHQQTALYGLIGNPVEKSPSHKSHNATLKQLKKEAVYVKMCLEEQEVLPFLKQTSFQGLSVTMPFKQLWGEPAINTLIRKGSEWDFLNTDGWGACQAIERRVPLKNKKLYIIGAGGTAYGIAREALKRGAAVTIYNRTLERAEKIAASLSCQAKQLDDLDLSNVDVLVQTTPVGWGGAEEAVVDLTMLPSHAVVLDVLNGPPTFFMQKAAAKGVEVIGGGEMFALQAVQQFKAWFPDSNEKAVEDILWDQLSLPPRK